MKRTRIIFIKAKDFLLVFVAIVAALWSITEAYTYITGDELKRNLGVYGLPLFYGVPFLVSVISMFLKTDLSRKELNDFNKKSVDPQAFGPIKRDYIDADLTNRQLRKRIIMRNKENQPSYLARLEYDRRLRQRGL